MSPVTQYHLDNEPENLIWIYSVLLDSHPGVSECSSPSLKVKENIRNDNKTHPSVPPAPVTTKEQDQSVSPCFHSLSKLCLRVGIIHTELFEEANPANRNRTWVPSGCSLSILPSLPSSSVQALSEADGME